MPATKAEAELTLIEKLAQASASIGPVAKDGNNSYQKYTFQSEAAIKAAVKKAIESVGIQIIPAYEVLSQYDKRTAKGGENHFVDVIGTFNITDGKETIVGKMPGSGQDTGEKAMAKACTSAQKYFYKQLFNITDKDEDPDADNSNPDGGYQQQQNNRRPNNQATQEAKAKHDKISAILQQVELLKQVVNNDEAAKSMFNILLGTNGVASWSEIKNANLADLNAISNGINDAIKQTEAENKAKQQKAGQNA